MAAVVFTVLLFFYKRMPIEVQFADGSPVDSELRTMTMSMIVSAVPEFKFSRREKRCRKEMLERVAILPEELQGKLRTVARMKQMEALNEFGKVDNDGDHVMEMANDVGSGVADRSSDEDILDDEENFLKAASRSVVDQCMSEFIDATGNDAVRQHVCMVCAREMWGKEVERCAVDDISNKHLLSPNEFHPAHVLTSGMLLERAVMGREEGRLLGDVCHDCSRALGANRTPALSLANGMWIGDVPPQLAILTLPERMLVAKYFPAAYIIKLSPKQKGASHWSSSGMNSGVRGNVATYKFNLEDIADIVDPKIMPPSAKILASVIGVIIIGPKNMPERTMLGYFRVRRDCVREALWWLFDHNSLYADNEISDQRLAELPENGVPREILESTRYSDDIKQLERSRAGYVNEDDDVSGDLDVNYCVAGMFVGH